MNLLFLVWSSLFFIFISFPIGYYLYMKRRATKGWELNIDEAYEPSVSILIPMHNEEKSVQFKLKNLCRIKYPPEKVQVILVNDNSTDDTLNQINQFVTSLHGFDVKVLNRTGNAGKSNSLNFALKQTTGDVIVVSDADCFWPSDILVKSMPYLSDPTVAAITGKELLLNSQQSWVTKSEQFYDSYVQTLRGGESKIHSTLFFQGGFAAYKRSFLEEFDHETDDSGTALNMVQKKGRTLLIPDARFYTMFPVAWKNKIAIKMRRASQLQQLWIRCLKLLVGEKLVLPKRIAVSNIFLHIFNPLIFVALAITTVLLIVTQPYFGMALLLLLLPVLLYPRTRTTVIDLLQNNFVLLTTLINVITKKKFNVWTTVDECRSLLNKEILQQHNLI